MFCKLGLGLVLGLRLRLGLTLLLDLGITDYSSCRLIDRQRFPLCRRERLGNVNARLATPCPWNQCMQLRDVTVSGRLRSSDTEMDMGCVHPWVGLGWVGLGRIFEHVWWVGLGESVLMFFNLYFSLVNIVRNVKRWVGSVSWWVGLGWVKKMGPCPSLIWHVHVCGPWTKTSLADGLFAVVGPRMWSSLIRCVAF